MPNATKKQVMCERKEPHKTLAAAQEHLERLKGLPDVTDVERLHIYWCPFPSEYVPEAYRIFYCSCKTPYPASASEWCSPCGKRLINRHMHVGHRRKTQQKFLEQRGIL